MALQHQYIDANIIAYWSLDVTIFNSIDFMKMIEMSCLECLQPWSAASRRLYAKFRACCLEAVWIPRVRFVLGALKTLAVRKEQTYTQIFLLLLGCLACEDCKYAAYSYWCNMVCVSVFPLDATVCTTATAELIDRFAVWAMDSSRLKEPHIRWGPVSFQGNGQFWGHLHPLLWACQNFLTICTGFDKCANNCRWNKVPRTW